MVYAVTNVDDTVIEKVRSFEEQAGVRLLALNDLDVQPADLDGATLDKIQALEKELGVTLVAVN
jgi:hypothetical protein